MKPETSGTGQTRQEKLAAELRANLLRRKAQARQRDAAEPSSPDRARQGQQAALPPRYSD